MIADETLHCCCGIEVRIVRLTPRITALGHVSNPRQNHHPVRLARSSSDAHSGVSQATSEGPATRREDVPNADPQTRTTATGTRASSNGRERTAVPLRSPSVTRLPRERASQDIHTPVDTSPRVPSAAGRRPQ